jgi:hypothetical protein
MLTVAELSNPYWDAMADHIRTDYDGAPVADPYDFNVTPALRKFDRHEMVGRYAWTITDPATVEFVARHIIGGVVDPMAGSGWWLSILGQLGVDGIGYDINPPAAASNSYHKAGVEHVEILQCDAAVAVAQHPDRTLLLSWPPYDDDIGARVLRAYAGKRVIYIGESDGGHCGDDEMHELLRKRWTEVASHRPVQHYGLHDWVTVYDRAGGES